VLVLSEEAWFVVDAVLAFRAARAACAISAVEAKCPYDDPNNDDERYDGEADDVAYCAHGKRRSSGL
jgi:hypothetical protein